ncbi:S1C family serine protease [Streptomyces ovatisporus]|uniref:S1C family serine protease n=1 Tax=Streptomyces ovatisporus TaxID=1128682 RepID=A0ABV9A288_9ACTN
MQQPQEPRISVGAQRLRHDPWAVPAPAPAQDGPVEGGRRGTRFVVAALLLSLAAGILGGIGGAYAERDGLVGDIELPQAVSGADAGANPGSIAAVAKAALPGVVTLHVGEGDGSATGTGFVLDKRGHILTNSHVVDSAADGARLDVTFHDGRSARGEVVGTDRGYDLAVVKVSGVRRLVPLPLGDSDSVAVGDPVVAIGAPFDLAGTVTNGIISATHRPVTAAGGPDGGGTSYVDALQTDAAMNPGNSGGPLVDSRGRVVGINSAIRSADSGSELPAGGEGGSIGLGFAIPVNQARRVAEELINEGRAVHPVLGVRLDMAYGGDGARVATAGSSRDGRPVVPGGPGDEAGIRSGDVITAVDGADVHSAEELIVKVRSHRPGDVLDLTVRRDGKSRPVRLELGAAADDE